MPKKIGINKFSTVAPDRRGSDLQPESNSDSDANDDLNESGSPQKKLRDTVRRRNTM